MLARSTRVIFGLFVVHAFGQTPSGIKQDATNASCANILAIAAGNVNINCNALTPVERRLIENIPAVLNRILAYQLDRGCYGEARGDPQRYSRDPR